MNLDGAGDKTRLTDQQKKKNHIESEKKRRETIRAGFEKLSKIIPECEGQARSEAVVLQRTVAYLRDQLKKKEELRKKAEQQGMSSAEFEQVYRDVETSMKEADEEEDGTAAGNSKNGGT